MKFGTFSTDQCVGAILAHSLKLAERTVKKGTLLNADDVAEIVASGVSELIVARLDPGDVNEDQAAQQIAAALRVDGIELSEAGTGRVNFHAVHSGVFVVNRAIVDRINSIDPGITFATLADHEPVLAGRMVATVKIIPYGISKASIAEAFAEAKTQIGMEVKAYHSKKVGVISTLLPALKDKTIAKTISVLERRLATSGSQIVIHIKSAHTSAGIEAEMRAMIGHCDMIIVFGASAISDVQDVIPLGLEEAGGKVLRVGMPVDPGNLLMLGELNGKPVLGAPGCARSPVENGFDFVLNRLLADIEVTSSDIAGMGVGGLLMEIGSRPQPRQIANSSPRLVSAIVLAGGQSRRMGQENKLALLINGKPMVRFAVDAAIVGGVDEVVVVTGYEETKIREVLNSLEVRFVQNPDFADGLSTSLKAGIAALSPHVNHALVLLGDMPEISGAMVAKMLSALENADIGSIIVATHDGKRGNPVIWPRAHFDALMAISGDTGARHIIGQNMDQVIEVELGSAASLDLDTPQAFEKFVKNR